MSEFSKCKPNLEIIQLVNSTAQKV